MVISKRLIIVYESNRLIFKVTQFTDDKGNISDKATWAFGENKLFGNTKETKKLSLDNEYKNAMRRYLTEFNAFDQAVRRNMASGMEWADAMTNARNEVGFTSDELKNTCMQMDEYYKVTKDGVISQDKLDSSWEKFNAQQQKVQANLEKTQKGFKGLSAGTKALIGNIGAELAIAFAIQAIGKAWDALNDRFQITPAKKIETMKNALEEYNTAMDESAQNIDTIKSHESEFATLAQGVDDAGRNVSLSADEYERYNEIVNELVAINPELIQGYTAEGNAIFSKVPTTIRYL